MEVGLGMIAIGAVAAVVGYFGRRFVEGNALTIWTGLSISLTTVFFKTW